MEARKFWGIPCEKSRIYAKKSYFFPIAEGGAKNVGVFRVKNHDFMPKNHIFSNFRGGGGAPGAPPPGSAPGNNGYPVTTSITKEGQKRSYTTSSNNKEIKTFY
jgi:hypothetical protein